MIVVHGIPSCDGVRAALRWLTEEGFDHGLRDLRTEPPGEGEMGGWADAVGWDRLLNRRGHAWRALGVAEREGVDRARAVALMAAHPLLIKRLVIDWGDGVTVGVDEGAWRNGAAIVRSSR